MITPPIDNDDITSDITNGNNITNDNSTTKDKTMRGKKQGKITEVCMRTRITRMGKYQATTPLSKSKLLGVPPMVYNMIIRGI